MEAALQERQRPRKMRGKITAVALILLLILSFSPELPAPAEAGGGAGMGWEFADTPLTWLNDVVWGEQSKFIAVGGNASTDGAIYSSADGMDWTRLAQVPDWLPAHSLMAVTYGAEGYVAVSSQGAILTSTDGETWQGILTEHAGFMDVTYENGIYVAVGLEGTIITSTNLKAWNDRSVDIKQALFGVYGTADGGQLFLAFGQNGVLYSSSDAFTWTARTSGTTVSLRAVAHRYTTDPVPLRFLVLVGDSGGIFTSTDGINWTAQTALSGIQFRDILYTGTDFIGVGTLGGVATSGNGADWTLTRPYIFSNAVSFNGIALNTRRPPSDRLVMVGSQGLIMWRSATIEWSRVRGGAETHLRGIHYGNNRFVTVGRGTHYWGFIDDPWSAAATAFYGASSDGETWTSVSPPFQQILNGISSRTPRGELYAVGESGRIQSSADGEAWSVKTVPVGTPTLHDITSMRLGTMGRRLIAVGEASTILTSDDGDTWLSRLGSGAISLRGLAAFPQTSDLFAVGSSGKILRSTDVGASWAEVGDIPGTVTFQAAAGNMERMVAVGLGGWVYTSEDGITWTARFAGTAHDLHGVLWGGSRFIATGAAGVILTSPDGITWTHEKSHTRHTLRDIHYEMAEETFYVVGDNYTILRASAAPPVPVTGLTLERDELELFLHHGGQTLTATLAPDDATNQGINWESSNPLVATVSKGGHVEPVAVGTAIITAASVDGSFSDTCTVTVTPVERLAGSNRFWTSVLVSQEGWPNGAHTVLLARSDDFADALAGVPLAYALDAPILLTPSHTVYNLTLNEIDRLGASHVILLGGTGAISDDVKTLLEGEGLTVDRLAGSGRYATAVKTAEYLFDVLGGFSDAVLADGTNFPDALAAASYAAINGRPILLTHPTILPPSTSDAMGYLHIENVLIVGGQMAVSQEVEDQIMVPGEVERVAGANRYETATTLARWFLPPSQYYYLATGLDFPDAISGAVLAAKNNRGVLLTYGPAIQPGLAVRTLLDDYEAGGMILFGGRGAISDEQQNWLINYFTPTD